MIQLFIIAGLVVLFFWLQMQLYIRYWKDNLEVDLTFQPSDMFEGDEGCLTEVITNNKSLPLPLFNVKFRTNRCLRFPGSAVSQKTDQYYRNDVFRIGRREKITRNLKFIADKRGYFHIDSVDLISYDLFMYATLMTTLELDEGIYVYPKPFYSREFLRSLQMVNGMIQTKRQFLEDPFEYRGMREYQPYDDMKSINWKATAKTGDFKVNLHDFTAVRSVRIFLNLEDTGIIKKEDGAEVCIRIAAGISKYFAEMGMKVSCYGNCRDICTDQILQKHEEKELQNIYRALACIDLGKDMPAFHKLYENRMFTRMNGEYTFVVSVNAYDEFVELLQRYSVVSEDFLWFMPVEKNNAPEIPDNMRKYFRPINIYQI